MMPGKNPRPAGSLDMRASKGRFIVQFRCDEDDPEVTVTCGYGDCEAIMTAIARARAGMAYRRVLAQGAVSSDDGRLLFATVSAVPGHLEWEVAAPFGIMGWRWEFRDAELADMEACVTRAMAQADSPRRAGGGQE